MKDKNPHLLLRAPPFIPHPRNHVFERLLWHRLRTLRRSSFNHRRLLFQRRHLLLPCLGAFGPPLTDSYPKSLDYGRHIAKVNNCVVYVVCVLCQGGRGGRIYLKGTRDDLRGSVVPNNNQFFTYT
jgi:hypothetical protein